MQTIQSIISELDQYCAATGLQPSTVCRYAVNNARLYERLKGRASKLDKDVQALKDWMSANPPPEQG